MPSSGCCTRGSREKGVPDNPRRDDRRRCRGGTASFRAPPAAIFPENVLPVRVTSRFELEVSVPGTRSLCRGTRPGRIRLPVKPRPPSDGSQRPGQRTRLWILALNVETRQASPAREMRCICRQFLPEPPALPGGWIRIPSAPRPGRRGFPAVTARARTVKRTTPAGA